MKEPQTNHHEQLERLAHEAMLERGFRPDFPAGAARELREIAGTAAPGGTEHGADSMRDLRALPWISIDNEQSRDLDQLTVAERRPADVTLIRVAVADVASAVRLGSSIDGHARANTTSVYTVPRVFPMLPPELSTDLTSLNEGCDRRAVIVELEVDPRGEVGASDVYVALVRNQAKLAYPSVGAWLEGSGPLPPAAERAPALVDQLRLQDAIAQRLEERRIEAGALDFDTRTPAAVYEDGQVTGIVETRHDRATKLIENFMIAANGVVARFLAGFGPVIQRVVRRPKNWPRLCEVAADLGEHLPKEPDGIALSRFLAKRRAAAPEGYRDLSLVVIKLLGRGEYVVGGERGHFGLAVSDYSHSTAPNRRLSDLVTQRLILAALARRARPFTEQELREIAVRCTEKEQDAEKVERHVRKCAAALFLEHRVGERFQAIVTGESEKGTWVRIRNPPIEGRLVREPTRVRVGDRLRVELVHVDVERGYIDFQLV